MENWLQEKLQIASDESYKDPTNIQVCGNPTNIQVTGNSTPPHDSISVMLIEFRDYHLQAA
ncbi:hypothetical protein DPMN_155724 [Dreissena polymorpha]|uniref:Uncharacterized protein n=1 Tax=Dreissena polymorpha TaxID=45954 RepID=A0A9D4J6W4_DREPO|nr:hypothetical protein DPMN_155724 [Dreissena polymorpha]